MGLLDPGASSLIQRQFLYSKLHELRMKNDKDAPDDVLRNQGAIKVIKQIIASMDHFDEEVRKQDQVQKATID